MGNRCKAVKRITLAAVVLGAWMLPGTSLAASFAGELADERHTFQFTDHDIYQILGHIGIAERHAAGETLESILPNATMPMGLRTIDGYDNNSIAGNDAFGAADFAFPGLTDREFRDADFFDPDGPGPAPGMPTSYESGTNVSDASPRIISQLITNQTGLNPAAVAVFEETDGASIAGQSLAGNDAFEFPIVAPDEALSAPINAWLTFFGQFFDHGLDLIGKGENGAIMMLLEEDDPLYDAGPDGIAGNMDDSHTNFMVLTRATQTATAGEDGVLGTDDDERGFINATTPFVDQNQTYTSHPSVLVFLMDYEMRDGCPQATGRLINGSGPDGIHDNEDDQGLARWKDVRTQARDKLGIELSDLDGLNMPVVAVDPYGHFVRGPNCLPQLVTLGDRNAHRHGPVECTVDTCVEGDLVMPVAGSLAIRTGQNQLIDIARGADPFSTMGAPLMPDDNLIVNPPGPPGPAGFYDDEFLGEHFLCGDGRCNENFGLSAVHHVFHSEHNRLAEFTKAKILERTITGDDLEGLNQWLDTPLASLPSADIDTNDPGLDWNGNRIFDTAKFGVEMQYNRIVFDEFVPMLSGLKDPFEGGPFGYHTNIDPTISLEFSQSIYRFGHSLLTETIDRFGVDFSDFSVPLVEAFLNPQEYDNAGELEADEAAARVIRGLVRATANELDEFVTPALQSNLLGLPLDLAAINIARGRDVGLLTLNQTRRRFYEVTGLTQLQPYSSWLDYADNLRHEVSIGNFVASYGTHQSILDATTFEERRAAAELLVYGGEGAPGDRLDFMRSQGSWAPGEDGIPTSGIEAVDLWVGGLAEETQPFGGKLGSTMNFVFETQMENLQNGDKFYYVGRTGGMDLFNELESNSFTALAMRNTNLGDENEASLPLNLFTAVTHLLEVDQTRQYNQEQADAAADAQAGLDAAQQAVIDALAASETAAQDAAEASTAAATAAQEVVDTTAALAAAQAAAAALEADSVADAETALAAAQAELLALQNDFSTAQNQAQAANTTVGQAQAAFDQASTQAQLAQAAALQARSDAAIAQATAAQVATPGPVVIATAFADSSGDLKIEGNGVSAGGAVVSNHPNVDCGLQGGGDFRCDGQNVPGGFLVVITDPNGAQPDAGEVAAAQAAANVAQAASAEAIQAETDAVVAFIAAQAVLENANSALGDATDAVTAAQAIVSAQQVVVNAAQAELTAAIAAAGATEAEILAAAQTLLDAQAAANAAQEASDAAAAAGVQAAADAESSASALAAAQAAVAELQDLVANSHHSDDPEGDSELIPLVIRDPLAMTTHVACAGGTTNVTQYTGGDHVVIGGTEGPDLMVGGIGDDSIWGRGGNDCIEGGDGADSIEGGLGDDIITDLGGPDVIEGGPGNDAIHTGNEEDVAFGDEGKDWMQNGSEFPEFFGGPGDDFIMDGGVEGILGVHGFIGHVRGGAGDDWMENYGGGEALWQGDWGAAAEGGEPREAGNDVGVGRGGNNDFDMESGDDIVLSGPGIERAEGQMGFDWISFANDDFGVNIDLDLTIFLRHTLPPSSETVLDRYDRVEGISGSRHGDVLRGTANDPTESLGNELVNFDLIEGLDEVVPLVERRQLAANIFTGEEQFGWTGGEIILAGFGSDIVVGEGGDDIIDGDKALSVGLRVGDRVVSSMMDLQAEVFAGEINPGDIFIHRVITDDDVDNVDTDAANFSGNRDDYVIEADVDGTFSDVDGNSYLRVTDNRELPAVNEGSDLVRNVERLVFADRTLILAEGLAGSAGPINSLAEGFVAIQGTPALDATLAASMANVTDPDNVSEANPTGSVTGLVSFAWEVELEPGSGDFDAITIPGGVGNNGGVANQTEATLLVSVGEVGRQVRVTALFQDEAGVFEVVQSDPVSIPIPEGFVFPDGFELLPVASFTGTAAELMEVLPVVENASGLGRPRLDFTIPGISLDQFDNTDSVFTPFPGAFGADAEMPVANIELRFVNDLTMETTGTFAPEIVAIQDPGTLVVDQGNVDISFSIRGNDVTPLVVGPTTAILTLGDEVFATVNLIGDSREADATNVLVTLINMMEPPDPELVGVPVASFVGTADQLSGRGVLVENASGVGLARFDFVVPDLPLDLFDNTESSFSPGFTAEAEMPVGNISLTFVNDLTNQETGMFAPEIAAVVDEVTGEVNPNLVNLLFSIRGADAAPLVTGATTVTLRLGEEVFATVRLSGNSAINDAQGVAVLLINEMVPPDPELIGVPVATFVGTAAELGAAALAIENASTEGRARLDATVSNLSLALFNNTEPVFPEGFGAEAEMPVANVSLTFVNDLTLEETGMFSPEIIAIQDPDTLVVNPDEVHLSFSIRGADVAPLVAGPTTATLRLGDEVVATVELDGNSGANDAQDVAVTLVNGQEPVDPELAGAPIAQFLGAAADIDAETVTFVNESRPARPRFDVTIPEVSLDLFAGHGFGDPIVAEDEIAVDQFSVVFSNVLGVTGTFTAEIVAISDPVDGSVSQDTVNVLVSIRNADVDPLVSGATEVSLEVGGVQVASRIVLGNSGVADATGVTGFDEIDTVPTLASVGTVDLRGRLRLDGNCSAGSPGVSAEGLSCRNRPDGSFSCRGRGLVPGTQIEAMCAASVDAVSAETAATGLAGTGTADARGRVRVSGSCGPDSQAFSATLRCSTRRDGRFRCSASELTPGQAVAVVCQ